MKKMFPAAQFEGLRTPFYYYDMALLQQTIDEMKKAIADKPNYHVHYAVKANANKEIIALFRDNGLGCDCVSGGEVSAAIEAGVDASKVVFAGVGKADWEIELSLEKGIFCFNVESEPELEIINEIAGRMGKTAKVAIRVNPNVDALTHHYITTGLNENKFGISLTHLDKVVDLAISLENIELVGLHFHIGSQLLNMEPFEQLCGRINELQDSLENRGVKISLINVGGGLGIDYVNPDENPIPDFANYFAKFKQNLKLREGQTLHFELGRALVAQCGNLVSKVLYVKEGVGKKFIILDGGMSDLIRPALYGSHHNIENISSQSNEVEKYDVVGPICESSDCFGKEETLPLTKRGDLLVLRSAGAYGQIMANQYNCRTLPQAVYSTEL